MVPINQVILGGDPLLSSSMVGNNIEGQLQALERYKQSLELARQQQLQTPTAPQKLIWDDIDLELKPLTEEQKLMLMNNEEYREIYNRLQEIVNVEILNLVKLKIENTTEGKELLTHQLKVVKKLKNIIIDETNREMELFRSFKEFSKSNPGVTYEEFIKTNMKK